MADIDFYLSLFDEFLKTNNHKNKKILWKLHSIVKIMEHTSQKENLVCENGLRMIMTLFNSFQFDSCDIESNYYDNSSVHQKDIVLPILKEEFI